MHGPQKRFIKFRRYLLRSLFGAATVGALHSLHDAISELQLQNADITNSVTNELNYVINLGMASGLNANAIANLSNK